MRYSLRPRLSRRLPIDQSSSRESFRLPYRRLALFVRRLHVRQFCYASNDRQTATPRCRGVNERLHYEAKARCIPVCRATFNAGERGENVAPALFFHVFYPFSAFFVVLRTATLSLCKGGLLRISRPLAKSTY